VFGLGFGELLVVMMVAVVVLGPKDLPRYMRKAGQMASKLRRLAFDMREKSGIDEVLRAEGLDRDIAEIRRLARGEITGVMAAVRSTADAVRHDASLNGIAAGIGAASPSPLASSPAPPASPAPAAAGTEPSPASPQDVPGGPALFTTDHEYPPDGADSYGALPETANVYGGDLPPSTLAEDPLYARGEEMTVAAAEAAP
jgi:sec-independent protein translocase protein TatB